MPPPNSKSSPWQLRSYKWSALEANSYGSSKWYFIPRRAHLVQCCHNLDKHDAVWIWPDIQSKPHCKSRQRWMDSFFAHCQFGRQQNGYDWSMLRCWKSRRPSIQTPDNFSWHWRRIIEEYNFDSRQPGPSWDYNSHLSFCKHMQKTWADSIRGLNKDLEKKPINHTRSNFHPHCKSYDIFSLVFTWSVLMRGAKYVTNFMQKRVFGQEKILLDDHTWSFVPDAVKNAHCTSIS